MAVNMLSFGIPEDIILNPTQKKQILQLPKMLVRCPSLLVGRRQQIGSLKGGANVLHFQRPAVDTSKAQIAIQVFLALQPEISGFLAPVYQPGAIYSQELYSQRLLEYWLSSSWLYSSAELYSCGQSYIAVATSRKSSGQKARNVWLYSQGLKRRNFRAIQTEKNRHFLVSLFAMWVYVFYGFYMGPEKLPCVATPPPSLMVLLSYGRQVRQVLSGLVCGNIMHLSLYIQKHLGQSVPQD